MCTSPTHSATTALTRSGGCYCGAVRFWAQLVSAEMPVCHCRQCVRATGGPFHAVVAKDADLHIKDPAAVAWYISSPGCRRGRFATCGSPLVWKSDAEAETAISVSTLEQIASILTRESALSYCYLDSDWGEEPHKPVKTDSVLTEFALTDVSGITATSQIYTRFHMGYYEVENKGKQFELELGAVAPQVPENSDRWRD